MFFFVTSKNNMKYDLSFAAYISYSLSARMVISIFRSCSQLIVLSYYIFCKITLYTASFTVYTVNNNKNTFVFKAMTGERLKPKSTKAILFPSLFKVIGRKKLYPMIAEGEYAAGKNTNLQRLVFPKWKASRMTNTSTTT